MPEEAQQKSVAKNSRASSPAPKAAAAKAASTKPDAAPVGDVRWGIASLCLGARLTVQANRIILGPLMPFIAEDFGFTAIDKGSVMSAFAAGYAITQIPGGNAADRIGSKRPLMLALFAVSIGSIVAPFAADLLGKTGLWWTYFMMGLLEGPSYPSIGSLLGQWFPPNEKSTANSRTGTGGSVGGLLATGIGPMIAARIGWRPTMMITGAASVAFSCLWSVRSADKPVTCPRVSEAELKYLQGQGVKGAMKPKEGEGSGKKFPWRLFRFPEVIAVCYAHGVFNFGRYFVYAWMSTFFTDELGMTATKAGACFTMLQIADADRKSVV